MQCLKTIARKNQRYGAVPPVWLFVRAAIVANVSVGTLVFIEFTVMSLVDNDGKTFRLGLWLVPFVTVVVWSSASAIYLMFLVAELLRALAQRLVSSSSRSGVWDDWLDSPS